MADVTATNKTTAAKKAEHVLTLCLTGTVAAVAVATTNSKSKKSSNTTTTTNNNNSTGTSRREIVHFHKTRATVKDLYLRAEGLFGVSTENNANDGGAAAAVAAAGSAKKTKPTNKKNSNSTIPLIMVLERRAGFPPRSQRLDRNSDQTLQQAGIENQERITVSFVVAQQTVAPVASMETATSTATSKPAAQKRSAGTAKAASAEASATTTPDDNKTAKKRTKKTSDKNSHEDEDDGEASSSCSREAAEENSAAATSPRARTQRAAAQRATESFAATMAAQDALVRQQQSSSSNSNKKQRASPKAAVNSKKKATTAFTASRTSAGRRLQDGAVVSRPTASQRRRRRVGGGADNDNDMGNDDPQAKAGIALLGALNGKDSSTGARLVRQGWRKAVWDAYEQNQATARLAAVATSSSSSDADAAVAPARGAAGGVQFECWKPAGDHSASLVAVSADESAVLTEDEQDNDNDDDTAATRKATWQLKVKYPKGVQGRGNFEERVDYISYVVLKSLIRSIYPVNAEALRPENLALISPRVLWSLLFHWQRRRQSNNNTNNAIHEALMTMHPDLDWSFLRRRKQQLSEKALENLRQQQEKINSGNANSVEQDYEAAAAAISAVEQAMQNSLATPVDQSSQQRQARMLQAAQQQAAAAAAGAHAPASGDSAVMDDNAIIVTPTETDEDELKACILAGVASRDGDDEETAKDDDDVEWDQVVTSIEQDDGSTHTYTVRYIVEALIQDCDIHNWRQLANSNGADALVEQLFAGNSSKSIHNNDDDALIDMVQAWIDRAREESLDEIMVEICQGQIEAVELLAQAKAATPKDLAPWKWIVDDLYTLLQQAALAASAANDDMATNHHHHHHQQQRDTPPDMVTVPTKQDLEQWCQRAQWALGRWEWLADYATPIE